MVSDRAFIFHVYIPRCETLSFVQKLRASVKVRVEYQVNSIRKNDSCGGIHVSQTHVVQN